MQGRISFSQGNATRIDHQAKDQQVKDQADGSLHKRAILTYTLSVANSPAYRRISLNPRRRPFACACIRGIEKASCYFARMTGTPMFHLHYWLHILSTPHGIAWVALVLVLVLALRRLRRSVLVFALAALPGTCCHELAHWLVGYISAGRPTRLDLLPQRNGRGYVLGAVHCANIRWYNAALVGLAPLLLLPAAAWLLTWRMAASSHLLTLANLLWGYLIACLLDGCVPSGQDLRMAGRSWLLLVGLLVLVSGRFV